MGEFLSFFFLCIFFSFSVLFRSYSQFILINLFEVDLVGIFLMHFLLFSLLAIMGISWGVQTAHDVHAATSFLTSYSLFIYFTLFLYVFICHFIILSSSSFKAKIFLFFYLKKNPSFGVYVCTLQAIVELLPPYAVKPLRIELNPAFCHFRLFEPNTPLSSLLQSARRQVIKKV